MAKGSKAKKVRPARRKAAERRPAARSKPKEVVARSGRELLIKDMLGAENGGERQFLVQDLIYNTSGELRKLAYKSGFELGRDVYASSDGTLGALEKALE